MNCPNHADALAETTCAACGQRFCGDCVVLLEGSACCAACKDNKVREIKSGIKVPDGLAKPSRRIYARLIDLFLLDLLFTLFRKGYEAITGVPVGARASPIGLSVVCYTSWFLYEGLFLSATGQTPGKRLLGIRVVSLNGTPLGNRVWIRVLLQLALSLPALHYPYVVWATYLCEALDVALLIYARRHRTIDDRIAGTLVVDVRQEQAARNQLSR